MKLQTFEASTGYTLQYRILPPDTMSKIEAAIRAEWKEAGKEPQAPINIVDDESGPRQKVNDKHPDHLKALAEYDRAVNAEVGDRLTRLYTDYAIECEVDTEAVAKYRAAMRVMGVDLTGEDDAFVFVWRVAVPDQAEQQRLAALMQGTNFAAAVEAQQRAFRREVERAADRISLTAEGQGGV